MTSTTPACRYPDLAFQARTAAPVPAVVLAQYRQLRAMPAAERRAALAALDEAAAAAVLAAAHQDHGTPYALWADTPSGFCEDVLGEPTWARRRDLLDATVDHLRVAAPICFGGGATFIAPLLAAWYAAVHPEYEAFALVVAPTRREADQQRDRLRVFAELLGLRGSVSAVSTGTGPDDWSALGGLGGAPMLVVAANAGAFHPVQGQAVDLVVGGPVRLVALGTPDMTAGTWFEDLAQRPSTHTVRMAVADLPPATGEDVGECSECPAGVNAHPLATHMADAEWAARAAAEYGPDHPYVVTRVHARFPTTSEGDR
jgi:hypothetical protein